MGVHSLHEGAIGHIFHLARTLRREQTKAERLLWKHLRGRQLKGFKFRRQHPIQNYIADFYCHECGLVIELDGGVHNKIDQKQYDSRRTFELEEYGLKVIRFRNEEVIKNTYSVVMKISLCLTPPSPLGKGRGEVN